MQKALTYIETCLKYGKSYNNTDTYAHVLFKLKRYDDALKAANEAIALAKAENRKYDGTEELAKKIQESMAGTGVK